MMKNIYILLVISLVMYSCCNKPSIVTNVRIVYPNLTSSENAYLIYTSVDDITNHLDTGQVIILEPDKNLMSIPTGNNYPNYNYIFYIENTQYIDTITDVKIEYIDKRCGPKLSVFEYKLNGVLQSSQTGNIVE